ncbi:MAG: DinB family protein [Planctomycetota bacterium]
MAALNQAVLRQGIDVIAALDDDQFRSAPAGLAHSGAGAHFRHIYDYYRCFLRDVDGGRVDYDLRDRDPRFETERDHAVACLGDLVERLGDLAERGSGAGEDPFADRPLEARMDAVGDAGEFGHWNLTTVQRELRFLVSHTIHHYALIALILKVKGFDCGPDFGVAPSTVEHWKRSGQ